MDINAGPHRGVGADSSSSEDVSVDSGDEHTNEVDADDATKEEGAGTDAGRDGEASALNDAGARSDSLLPGSIYLQQAMLVGTVPAQQYNTK